MTATTSRPVVIGMDPHKRSMTIEIMDRDETVLGTGRFTTDQAGVTAMLKHVRAWPQRVWAIEGSNGVGRPIATRLATAGETVVDVPTKLSARVRVYATGNARKTDDTDAHAIALAGAGSTSSGRWCPTKPGPCYGSCPTGVEPWPPTAPGPWPSCITCSANSSPAGPPPAYRRPGPPPWSRACEPVPRRRKC
ncbi:transposase [Ammonicoccus fulvus]|uniref:Transposase n=1 Tax=Ammonicoccus fulvus TaxID=3138240 RepID=A0ABZ3FR86_9ACTN